MEFSLLYFAHHDTAAQGRVRIRAHVRARAHLHAHALPHQSRQYGVPRVSDREWAPYLMRGAPYHDDAMNPYSSPTSSAVALNLPKSPPCAGEPFPQPVRAERKAEEKYMTGAPPLLDEQVIRYTRVYFDQDDDFIIEFENHRHAYAVIVVLRDRHKLTFRETRAISDAIKIGARGTAVDNAVYFTACAQLRDKYQVSQGPIVENDRLVCLFDPSHVDYNAPARSDAIDHLELAFDSDADLVITAHTQQANDKSSSFKIVLALSGAAGALCVADCKALRDILATLEPGERLDLTDFLCHLATLRESYGFLRLGKIDDAVCCLLHASKVRNDDDLPLPIASALEARKQKRLNAEAEAAAAAPLAHPKKPHKIPFSPGFPVYPEPNVVQSPPPSPLPHCPYPDMSYTRALTESGQAQVYAGEKLSTKEKVAIKVFLGAGSSAGSTFRTELRMLLKMPEHPNVISVLDFFEYPRPALITRLIEGGGDMLQCIREKGRMDPSSATTIAAELADGVLHLHRNGIVHRDLKSANVLLRAKPQSNRLTPVIIDLGLGAARRAKRKHAPEPTNMNELMQSFAHVSVSEKTQGVKGTPFWMAPEMIRAQEWSEKTDVYAFGIILWEMLSGHVPYNRTVVRDQWDLMWRVMQGMRPDMEMISHAPKELQSLVSRCWRQEPKERPTMLQVVDELRGSDPEAIFRSVDIDGSNTLDFAEVVGFLGRYAPETPPQDMFPIFQGMDSNGSGTVSLKEFLTFWDLTKQKGIHIALKECQVGRPNRRVDGR